MHIRKSADGSQPQHPKNNGTDKDHGATRKKSVEGTRPAESEKRAEAQPKPESKDRRPAGDSFERSRPQADPGVDVGERLRKARSQARGDRVDNARTKDSREQRQGRIENARTQDTEARREARVENARTQNTQAQREARIENARAKHTEQQRAERIESARAQSSKNADPVARARANFGDLSRESVQISGDGLSNDAVQSASGVRETSEARAERIQILRMEHENGILNTVERSRSAARRLLGDV